MSSSLTEKRGWIHRWGDALVGPRAARDTSWAVRGALAIVLAEVLAVLLTAWLGPLIPLGMIAIVLFAGLCWISLPAAWLVTLAAVPFSMEVAFPAISAGLYVPTEPLIFTFLAVWTIKGVLGGAHSIPRSAVLHSILLMTLIAGLSSLQSLYPGLSWKALANSLWYTAFAFLFPYLEERKNGFLKRAVWTLAGSSLFFAFYGLFFIASNGVARWTGNAMGRPFFPEHGTYSAFLSFGLAMLLGIGLSARREALRWLAFAGAGAVTLAIVLCLARAAYLGVVASVGVLLWYLLRSGRARGALLMIAALSLVVVGVSKFRAGQFVGLYVSTIAQPGELSNLERISRWMTAAKMVQDRPILGVGYGTYPTAYYSYRVLTLRTEDRFRFMGVHSEYFAALSEMGWLGLAALLWFIFTVARVADRVIRRAADPRERTMALAALAGLASYFVHGFFNNYSGRDKLSLPLWLLVGIISALALRLSDAETPAPPATT